MFTTNPYAALSAFLSPALMQGYLVVMVLLVVAGTAFDLWHDGKAQFFRQDRRRARAAAERRLDVRERWAIAGLTLLHDIATFGEFCNRRRRLSHALMFYGFVFYLITTVVLVWVYPTAARVPWVLPLLWHGGVLMTLVGGWWFFLFLRVNVVHDGQPPWRLVQADLFIVTLLGSVTFALLFSLAVATGIPWAIKTGAALHILFTTVLFASVPWSKFAHMFYKPVVAFQRRVEQADGSSTLPASTTTRGERCPHSHT